ncbi:MAG TPA: hypothetical protein ENK66_02535 [Arcobacter sp.]|nr:hypothetical protein [Arcobacter sp.]
MKFANMNGEFSSIQWQYLALAIIGTVLSFVYMSLNDAAYNDPTLLLAIRKYLIQITFSIALYEFLKAKDLQYVLDIIFLSIIPNILMGTYELIQFFPERIQMLFPEPSAAGYYYLFVFFILFENFKQNIPFWLTRYYMVLGLAIGSKAQVILLSVVAVLKYSTPLKLFSLFVVSLIILYFFKDTLLGLEVIKYNLKVLSIYLDEGLSGLKTSSSVWGTYVTRISAIQGALMCLAEHPFGIGFGGFNSWYVINMVSIPFESAETDAIFAGIKYASTKSNLLNFFVSTGLFGILFYIFWFKSFFQIRRTKEYLFQSFIILSLASTFIELNPMYVYFMILFILKEKEANNI